MLITYFRKKVRKWYRRSQRHLVGLTVVVMVLIGSVLSYTVFIKDDSVSVDPTTYVPLLDLIAQAESNGNYNAYFSNAGNTAIDFTSMSIGDVMQWQARYVADGHASSAVGRYQFIDTTLAGLVHQLRLDAHQRFNRATQDRLAIALLERRGSVDYATGELSPEQFAANLAKEWAGLPRVTGARPNDSYYASDGLNASRVSVEAVLTAIKPISVRR